jgi:MFS family permease
MNKNSRLPPARAATSPATLVFLVSTAVFIAYIDRGTLATAAPLMQDELHLSASQLGILLSAFYYGYALVMAPVSWLVERYGAPRMLALGVVVWSVATLATGFANGFATILALRLLLGLGESPAFPAASKVFANTLDITKLGLANGWLSFGYLLGPVVGTLVGGLMMSAYGWRPVFIVFGCVSLLWLLPWSRVVVPQSVAAVEPALRPPSLRQILRQRSLWGACLGMFSANYSFYFILAWLPFYLVKARGLSIESMAWTASWAYLLNAVAALWMGWLTDRRIRAGASPTVIYKSLMALFHIAGSSRPGEFHPQALTDPDVNVSAHPALIVQPSLDTAIASERRARDRARQPCESSARLAGDAASSVCISPWPSTRGAGPDSAAPGKAPIYSNDRST